MHCVLQGWERGVCVRGSWDRCTARVSIQTGGWRRHEHRRILRFHTDASRARASVMQGARHQPKHAPPTATGLLFLCSSYARRALRHCANFVGRMGGHATLGLARSHTDTYRRRVAFERVGSRLGTSTEGEGGRDRVTLHGVCVNGDREGWGCMCVRVSVFLSQTQGCSHGRRYC
jgi:hypothetical protein